ncbi:MAG: hypothetical protein K6F35_01305 [Lachnospiraceae bacterium]|nr:hypothetical protein [Lachnospiraceae bacterium]
MKMYNGMVDITEAGARELFATAKALSDSVREMEAAEKSLTEAYMRNVRGLGYLRGDIEPFIRLQKRELRRSIDNAEGLIRNLKEMGDWILSKVAMAKAYTGGDHAGNLKADPSGLLGEEEDPNDPRPVRSVPRSLPGTMLEEERLENGGTVYGNPELLNRYMYAVQGNAYDEFQGTCGLCAVANLLRMAGVNMTEKQVIDFAAPAGLCAFDQGNDPGENGGTDHLDRQSILAHFGVQSELFDVKGCGVDETYDRKTAEWTLEQLATFVTEGKGVIVNVNAYGLWGGFVCFDDDPTKYDDSHAVLLTGVKKDAMGRVDGFYVCDSANNGTSYYDRDMMIASLTDAPANVTTFSLR